MLLSSLCFRQFWPCCINSSRRFTTRFRLRAKTFNTPAQHQTDFTAPGFRSSTKNDACLAVLSFPIHTSSAMSSDKLDSVSDVDIDEGRFKYILIKLDDYSGDKKESKFIVRGYSRAGYHGDIYDEVEPKLKSLGIKSDCVGGGRILHDVGKKTIQVFGYSTGYGKADHSISTEILKKKYPDYTITWSDEGY